jgi:hypothetical protein
MEERSSKEKRSTGGGGYRWYQKPVGILLLTVFGGILIWLVTTLLQNFVAPSKTEVRVIEVPTKVQTQVPQPSEPQQPKSQRTGERKEREKQKLQVEEEPKQP